MTTENDTSLPKGFESLEPFVADWSLAKESERASKRWSSDFKDIRKFYDAILPCLEKALDYLNKFDLYDMPEPEQRLFNLTLSLAEIADAVEAFGESAVPYAFSPDTFTPTEA